MRSRSSAGVTRSPLPSTPRTRKNTRAAQPCRSWRETGRRRQPCGSRRVERLSEPSQSKLALAAALAANGQDSEPDHRGTKAHGWRRVGTPPHAVLRTRNAQLTGRHAHPGAGRFVVLARSRMQGCIPASPWSHLWSHSCKFRGARSGLPSLGSGATGPNRTGLNHQPQNSKAREGQPSAGSNPAATASPIEKCRFYP